MLVQWWKNTNTNFKCISLCMLYVMSENLLWPVERSVLMKGSHFWIPGPHANPGTLLLTVWAETCTFVACRRRFCRAGRCTGAPLQPPLLISPPLSWQCAGKDRKSSGHRVRWSQFLKSRKWSVAMWLCAEPFPKWGSLIVPELDKMTSQKCDDAGATLCCLCALFPFFLR